MQTEAGPAVRCAAAVVATNSPVNDLVVIHTKQAPYLSYVIAAPVPPGSVPPGLFWDDADPYHYVRQQTVTPAGGGPSQHLLLVGGEDHKTGQEEDPAERYRRLEEWSRPRFPQMGKVAYAWSGQVMETIDGLAFIGHNPLDRSNVYVATGDSGMGMTHGTIAGILLTDLIMGRNNPWTALYAPNRKRLRAVGKYARENLNVAWQYTDWLTPGEVSSVDDIPRDSGAIVQVGLSKLAVYRDEQDRLHRLSASCSHLGCVVHWNPAEKTWDCPCHGSRFDCQGRVLNGPAVKNLSPAEQG